MTSRLPHLQEKVGKLCCFNLWKGSLVGTRLEENSASGASSAGSESGRSPPSIFPSLLTAILVPRAAPAQSPAAKRAKRLWGRECLTAPYWGVCSTFSPPWLSRIFFLSIPFYSRWNKWLINQGISDSNLRSGRILASLSYSIRWSLARMFHRVKRK